MIASHDNSVFACSILAMACAMKEALAITGGTSPSEGQDGASTVASLGAADVEKNLCTVPAVACMGTFQSI